MPIFLKSPSVPKAIGKLGVFSFTDFFIFVFRTSHSCTIFMNSRFCLVIVLILFLDAANLRSQSIGITSPAASTSYCAGASTLSITYTITGTFSNTPSANVFSAQISDATGSFGGSPETIGTITSALGGTISCTLPSNLLTSNLYRFRVVSSNPPINGSDNGANLTIFAITLNTPTVAQSTFCRDETFTVNFSQGTCDFVNVPSANVYSVELSNASGSFTSPLVIGTRTATTAGVITCSTPSTASAGSGYRIRMVSSSPFIQGPDNGSNLTITAPTGTPSLFGTSAWNVYCYNAQSNYTLNYQGFYTENNLSFNTTTRWVNTASPSSANAASGSAYTGCPFGPANYSYSYKRTNIPCGYYQIDIPSRRNEVYIIINGVTVFQNTVCCAAFTNVWRGVIQTTDNVEIRSSNLSPQGFLAITFTKLNQVTMSAPVTVCASSNATLTVVNTGTLPVTFSWTPSGSVSPTTGATVIATPAVTTNYTVTATASACPVFTGAVLVTVNPVPTTATSITSTVICNGFSSSQITATGANTYSWSPSAGLSATVGNIVTASPTITTTYTVTGSNNCNTVSATRIVSVQNIPSTPSPTAFGSGVWNVYCYNSSTFANYFGFYTENNLSFNSTSRWANTLSPSSANASSGSAYTGCNLTNAAHGTISRRTNFTCGYYRLDLVHNDLVTVFVNGIQVFTNAAAATSNAAWTGFLGPTSTVEIRHANTTGNTSSIQASFVIVPIPTLSPPVTICAGSTATLTAGSISGLNYSWTPSTSLTTTTGTITISSTTISTNYTCTVTDPVTTCSSSSSTSVTINPLPTTTVSPTSATVNCASQVYTLSAGGANTYSWSPSAGLSATTGNSVVASPTVNTTYTVAGNNNCATLNATTSIVVVPLVTPTVFPTGTWNAYCYNSTSFTNYFGYYTENGSGPSTYDFNTATRWASGGAPSTANAVNGNAYLGCIMPTTNWSMSFRRRGFACNTYSIHILSNDDNASIFINGVQVATRGTSTNSTALWVGVLSPSTTVEFRLVQNTTGSGLSVLFAPAVTSPSVAVWAGAISTNWFTSSNWCSSSVPNATTNVIIYNSGTLFQPAITATGAACANLTISAAVAATATLSAIAAAGLTVSGAFGLDVNGNWFNNGTFSAGTGTVSILGTGSKTLTCAGTQTFHVLVLNNTGTITIPSGTHRISNNMNLTSGIVLLTGNLQFLNGSTVSNANDNSYIQGTIVKFGNQAFTFPLGLNGLYRPIGISAPVSATDNFTAEYLYTDPSPSFTHTSKDVSIDHISRCEYWNLNRTGGSSIVNVTLSWNVNSCGVNSLPDLTVARWDAGQVKWKDQGNGGTTGNTIAGTLITSAPVTVFSPFTLGSKTALNPLPIELLDFSAKCSEQKMHLKWSTSTEINNDYFLVESSTDGINWVDVQKVKSKGNGSMLREYSVIDPALTPEAKYYRLSQVDNDFKKEVFKTVYASCEVNTNDFKFYPNPCQGEINLAFNVLTDSNDGVFEIHDNLGKTCLTGRLSLKKGSNLIPLQVKLPSGVYFISYTSSAFKSPVQKLLVD
jgi:hypothetical protein